jgi:predicted transposase/invertase (TIGR01784 family)
LWNLKGPKEKIFKAMDHETYMNRPHPMGSTAWQIEEKGKVKGRAEGMLEGKLEGKVEVALNMLKAGFNVEKVTELTGLSMTLVRMLPV